MTADDLLQIITKVDDLEAKSRVGRQHIQQVDVRSIGVLTASHRTEDGQLGDTVAPAHLGDPAVTKIDRRVAIIPVGQPQRHGSGPAFARHRQNPPSRRTRTIFPTDRVENPERRGLVR